MNDAVCVLYNLALQENACKGASKAAVEKIVSLITSHDMSAELHAVGVAAGLSTSADTRKLLLESYSLEPLTALARSGAYRLHLLASCALIHFSLENAALNALSDEAVKVQDDLNFYFILF